MLCGRNEEVGHTVGPPRHRHFVGFSPLHGANLFTVITKNSPISVTFYDVLRDTETYSHLKPSGSPWGNEFKCFYFYINLDIFLFIILF